MIRADIYSAIDYLHQKKIVDRLRFSALNIIQTFKTVQIEKMTAVTPQILVYNIFIILVLLACMLISRYSFQSDKVRWKCQFISFNPRNQIDKLIRTRST
jgi:hypothetical protein